MLLNAVSGIDISVLLARRRAVTVTTLVLVPAPGSTYVIVWATVEMTTAVWVATAAVTVRMTVAVTKTVDLMSRRSLYEC
jgi:hypothetical protein